MRLLFPYLFIKACQQQNKLLLEWAPVKATSVAYFYHDTSSSSLVSFKESPFLIAFSIIEIERKPTDGVGIKIDIEHHRAASSPVFFSNELNSWCVKIIVNEDSLHWTVSSFLLAGYTGWCCHLPHLTLACKLNSRAVRTGCQLQDWARSESSCQETQLAASTRDLIFCKLQRVKGYIF